VKEYSIFDIIGPVMIGPSSSHTAGAVRIAYMARSICGEKVKKVNFFLHGSFAKTYKGHGTDLALLAGILGFLPHDSNVRNSIEIAKEQIVEFSFTNIDLGEVHPNSVKIAIETISGQIWEVCGSSIGGGKTKIFNINNMEVDFDGEYTTLITHHIDCPGVTASVTSVLANHNVNIAFMKLFREERMANAILIIETDNDISSDALKEIMKNKNIKMTQVLKPCI
jgi:L-serine dehydratase